MPCEADNAVTDISARRAFLESPAGDAYASMAAAVAAFESAATRLDALIELARDLRRAGAERIGDLPRDVAAAHWRVLGEDLAAALMPTVLDRPSVVRVVKLRDAAGHELRGRLLEYSDGLAFEMRDEPARRTGRRRNLKDPAGRSSMSAQTKVRGATPKRPPRVATRG